MEDEATPNIVDAISGGIALESSRNRRGTRCRWRHRLRSRYLWLTRLYSKSAKGELGQQDLTRAPTPRLGRLDNDHNILSKHNNTIAQNDDREQGESLHEMSARKSKHIPISRGSRGGGEFKEGNHVPDDEDSAVVVAESESDSQINKSSSKTQGNLESDGKKSLLELPHMPEYTQVFDAQGKPGD